MTTPGAFFTHALTKKKDFYWAWDGFMIVVRHYRNGRRVLVLEVEMPDPPFLDKVRVDVSHLPAPVLLGTLLYLLRHYPGDSPRNRQHSSRILSFVSFTPPRRPSTTCPQPPDLLLVSFLSHLLAYHGIHQQSR